MRLYTFCFAVLCCFSIVLTGCGGSTSSPLAPAQAQGPPNPAPQFAHVVLVVEENHSFSDVIGSPAMPFLNHLAGSNGLATNYFADVHMSIGDYFMLTVGSVETLNDAFTGAIGDDNIVRELSGAGKTWKSYAEGLPSIGYLGGDVYPYFKHHDPFTYFTDVTMSAPQASNIVPFNSLQPIWQRTIFRALRSSLPTWSTTLTIVPGAGRIAMIRPDSPLPISGSSRTLRLCSTTPISRATACC